MIAGGEKKTPPQKTHMAPTSKIKQHVLCQENLRSLTPPYLNQMAKSQVASLITNVSTASEKAKL